MSDWHSMAERHSITLNGEEQPNITSFQIHAETPPINRFLNRFEMPYDFVTSYTLEAVFTEMNEYLAFITNIHLQSALNLSLNIGNDGIAVFDAVVREINIRLEDINPSQPNTNKLIKVEVTLETRASWGREEAFSTKIDTDYPHTCFKCKKKLYFSELLFANRSIPQQQLEDCWKSAVVEFYCCTCYSEVKK